MMGNHKKNEKPCNRRTRCSNEYTWWGKRKNGFTLAELLIVVAIIAVLVAISIPVFTKQLEKSREATDLANVRSAYSEVMTAAILEDRSAVYSGEQIYQTDGTYQAVVKPLKQKQDDWQSDMEKLTVGGVVSVDTVHWHGIPKANGECTVRLEGEEIHFYWENGTGTGGVPGSEGKDVYTQLTENSQEYPSGGFTGVKGNVYSYDGKNYVCIVDGTYNEGGNPTTWYQAQFVELKEDARIMSSDNFQDIGGGNMQLRDVKRGDLYTDGTDYYICHVDSSVESAPPDNNRNWTKINP